MTLPANIRVNVAAPFPAKVKGSGPVTINKQNGIWTVGFSIAAVGAMPVATDPAVVNVLLWNTLLNTFQQTPVNALPLSIGMIVMKLPAANFNSVADQPIAIRLPAGMTRYAVHAIRVSNPSISLTTAVGGIYTAPAKGGIALLSAATAYNALTTNVAGAAGSMANFAAANALTAFYNSATLYLSLTTPQGAPATADVTLFLMPLP